MRGLVAILMLSLCGVAVHHLNIIIKQNRMIGNTLIDIGKVFGTLRSVIRLGYIEVMYRYADLRDTRENRIKFTGEFFSYKDLTVEGRMEFRSFDKKEDHWRYRFIFEYTPHLYGNWYLYAKLQPRWAFKDADTKFDSRDQLGITYKQGNWKITPFIERKGTEGWDKKMTVIGTHFEIKL